jgi:uncharacterized FlaG/YvyC family protein
MEGMGIKGNAPAGKAPGWSHPVPAVRGEKLEPSAKKPAKVDQVAALEVAFQEAGARNQAAVKALSERLETFLEKASYSLQFIPNRDSGRVTVKVLDSNGKVIRQIPPEDLARLSTGLETSTGVLVDEILK